MRDESDTAAPLRQNDLRRAWIAPHYAKVRAGDAESGPNPDFADGAFTFS